MSLAIIASWYYIYLSFFSRLYILYVRTYIAKKSVFAAFSNEYWEISFHSSYIILKVMYQWSVFLKQIWYSACIYIYIHTYSYLVPIGKAIFAYMGILTKSFWYIKTVHILSSYPKATRNHILICWDLTNVVSILISRHRIVLAEAQLNSLKTYYFCLYLKDTQRRVWRVWRMAVVAF